MLRGLERHKWLPPSKGFEVNDVHESLKSQNQQSFQARREFARFDPMPLPLKGLKTKNKKEQNRKREEFSSFRTKCR